MGKKPIDYRAELVAKGAKSTDGGILPLEQFSFENGHQPYDDEHFIVATCSLGGDRDTDDEGGIVIGDDTYTGAISIYRESDGYYGFGISYISKNGDMSDLVCEPDNEYCNHETMKSAKEAATLSFYELLYTNIYNA